jgi:hypothetical protein
MNNQFKPILFSTQMVQAILDGRKTQTRRLVKPQPKTQHRTDTRLEFYARRGENWEVKDKWAGDGFSILDSFKCPYGKVGDVLWVREKFRALVDCESGKFHSFSYYADMPEAFHKQFPHKWKPSIHMPKNACRLFLEITKVRVERLQDISEQDAIAEGVKFDIQKDIGTFWWDYINGGFNIFLNAYKSFKSLWSSINGADSWNANPWVWVVEFKRIEKPVNF